MDIEEFTKLMRYVEEECGWGNNLQKRKGKATPLIKYVSSSFDTRTNRFWRITFNTMAGDKQFLCGEPGGKTARVWDFVRGVEQE